MYENRTEHNIRKEMLDKVFSPVSKMEGTLIYDSLSPVANELSKHYLEMDSILIRSFLQTTYGEWLDKKAAEFGIYRKAPTYAMGSIRVNGLAGSVVPLGFIVANKSGLQYATTETRTIGSEGYVDVAIQAYGTGSAYNVIEGEITNIITTQVGVISVSNIEAVNGGSELEDDEDLRERALDRARNQGTSGNAQHYKQWALEVEGVGDAKVFPNDNGPGTVGVCVIDKNREPANNTTVNAVYANIEAKRPVGATVSVEAATPWYVEIKAYVKRSSKVSREEMYEDMEKNVIEVIRDTAFKETSLSYAKITNAVMISKGVLDCTSLTINGTTGNIYLRDKEVPLLRSLTVLNDNT